MKMTKEIENKKKEKKYKYTFIQFSVSDEFKEKIELMAGKGGFTTISDFVRDAIKDKIRRIEHPEIFNESRLEIDNGTLKRLLEMSGIASEKIDTLLGKFEKIEKIERNLQLLFNLENREVLKEKEEEVIKLLQEHTVLFPKKIMELTHIDRNELYQIISDLDKFSIIDKGVKLANDKTTK